MIRRPQTEEPTTPPTPPTPKQEPAGEHKERKPKETLSLELAHARVLTVAATKKEEREAVKMMAQALVTDPLYLLGLQKRMRDGKVAPAVEVALWNYAFGKPKEQIEVKKATAVKIVHEFMDTTAGARTAKAVLEGGVIDVPTGTSDSNAVERTTDAVPTLAS